MCNNINELLGKTLTKVEQVGDDKIYFYTNENKIYKMHHWQDCCESVYIEDICGDLNNLVGSAITMAEESSNSNDCEYGSETWTFYRFATTKGYVTIRWYGSSNGCYSESVAFTEVDENGTEIY